MERHAATADEGDSRTIAGGDEREEFARLMGEYFSRVVRLAIDDAVRTICAELHADIEARVDGPPGDKVISIKSVTRLRELTREATGD